jgi:hypothetical protein
VREAVATVERCYVYDNALLGGTQSLVMRIRKGQSPVAHVVPPQNLVQRAIVDVSALGVKLAYLSLLKTPSMAQSLVFPHSGSS